MPWRNEIENSESRGERRRLNGAVVQVLLSELNVQQGDEDGGEDQYDDENRSKRNDGSGHGGL